MITEALLEMLYFEPLLRFYQEELGREFLRVLKPSQNQEVWVGFDQGWVSTSVGTGELLSELREAVQKRANDVSSLYFGYFLQFKCVDEVRRKSGAMPAGFAAPYYRSTLSLKRNPKTGMSQHETLKCLAEIKNARVSYACPMVVTDEEVMERPVDLGKLRIVDVRTSPPGWNTNENHYIAFRTKLDPNPMWCSKPTPAISVSVEEWFSAQEVQSALMDPKTTIDFLESAKLALSSEEPSRRRTRAPKFPTQLTLIEFAAKSE